MCPFTVRVARLLSLADFLGGRITLAIALPEGFAYYRVSALGMDLPVPIYAYALQRPIPSGRGGVTAPSGHH